MGFFLPKLGDILENIDKQKYKDDWIMEYNIIVEEFQIILDVNQHNTKIETFDDIGLVVVQTENPLHYYSLFSATKGYDYVLSIYEGHRYELETKYTTYVDLTSRPCLPRLDMLKLATKLNKAENLIKAKTRKNTMA